MATNFKKGDVVKLSYVVPEGPVQSISMDEEGTVRYLITWTTAEGVEQSRWFAEETLVAV